MLFLFYREYENLTTNPIYLTYMYQLFIKEGQSIRMNKRIETPKPLVCFLYNLFD